MKKILCLLLTLVLTFSLCVPAFAAEESKAPAEPVYESEYPFIMIRGIRFDGLTYEDSGKLALRFNFLDLLTFFIDLIGKSVKGNKDAFYESVASYAKKLLGPLASDKDGSSLYPVTMIQYPTALSNDPEIKEIIEESTDNEYGMTHRAGELFGYDHTYLFEYDWRKDPLVLSDEVNELVQTAKKETGKDKVNIFCCSMGGMVATAYLYEYGYDDVNSIAYLSGAQNGTYVVGSAMSGDICFDAETISNLVSYYTDGIHPVLTFLIHFIDRIGVYKPVCNFLNNFFEKYKDRIYDEILRDCFGTSLGLWGMCPDVDFDRAYDNIFGGREAEYPVVTEALKHVKKFVFSTEETMLGAQKAGVKLSVVSNYNRPLVPVYDKANLNGDSVLETELTSNFATVALHGERLSDDYIAAADKKYISPDMVVDTSTCVFKDNTWMVKDAPHVAGSYGTDYSDLVFWLITSDRQPTVTMNERFPQFLAVDKNLNFVSD